MFFKHPLALVETEDIGEDTRIWAFAHVMKEVTIGTGSNIGDHCFIESGVRIGNDVTIKNGVSVWSGVTLEDGVFVGPNAVFTNDLRPRSKVYHSEPVPTIVRRGVSIGANATIVAGVTLGEYCLIGAGSVVTKDVNPYELIVGNPGRVRGYISRVGEKLEFKTEPIKTQEGTYTLSNGKVSFIPAISE